MEMVMATVRRATKTKRIPQTTSSMQVKAPSSAPTASPYTQPPRAVKMAAAAAPKMTLSVPYMCVVLSSRLRKNSYTPTGCVKGAVRCIP